LESILPRAEFSQEILLVDDCSFEHPPDSIARFIDQHGVRYIRHKRNLGLAAARNSALFESRGRYFSFCDDDDRWPDDLGRALVAAICDGPNDCRMALALHPRHRSSSEGWLGPYPRLRELMQKGVTPPVSSQLYETEMLRSLGGYRPNIRSGVDHDLWISLAAIDPVVAVCWREPAIVGRGTKEVRMTTQEDERRQRVSDALTIWKPALVDTFSEGFYRHFCQSYQQHLDFGFLLNSIRRRDYAAVVRKATRGSVLRAVLARVVKRMSGRRACAAFPEYRGE
jgi:glycosyltransferase involved in cell wall biosynthesis